MGLVLLEHGVNQDAPHRAPEGYQLFTEIAQKAVWAALIKYNSKYPLKMSSSDLVYKLSIMMVNSADMHV